MRRAWNPARVIDQGETPRSYLIETGTGAYCKEIESILDQIMLRTTWQTTRRVAFLKEA